jgi:hypothetical protein
LVKFTCWGCEFAEELGTIVGITGTTLARAAAADKVFEDLPLAVVLDGEFEDPPLAVALDGEAEPPQPASRRMPASVPASPKVRFRVFSRMRTEV